MNRLTATTCLQAVPGLSERFSREVPGEYWTHEPSGAAISCPCGETPKAREDRLTPCGCGRWFLLLGERVRCAKP